MAVTIKDIAAAAGVSPSTVSRTCKDSPSISRDTKERIRRIMAQMGYEPNFEAEPSEAFSKTIGIILPSSQRDVYENAFHLEIIRGIGQFCNQRRYVNTVITGEDDAEVLDAIQSMVANTQADGFILLYSKKDCPVAAYLRSEGLLHVIVGKAAQSANQTIYIDNDNALAGEEATDYLYEMGHRRIAYFGVSNAMLFSAERKRGYQMSLLKHDITPREGDCVEIDTLTDSYEPALKALLTAPDRPTAVLVSDDILAVVLEQFCSKLGLRIPKDLSIVSFNNSLFSRITNPPLTTVDVNPYQLGIETASFNGRSSGRAAGASVRFRNTAAPSTPAAAHPAQPIRKVLRFIRSASPLCADVLHLSAHRDGHRRQGVLHRANTMPVGNSTFHACFTRSDCLLP